MYQKDDFDLAGFSVGVVEKNEIMSGKDVKSGDVLIGVASSGIHSNGYSLVRKIVADSKIDLSVHGDAILAPTKLYPPLMAHLLSSRRLTVTGHGIHGIAHITGGGLPGNVPRIIPDGLTAVIDMKNFPRPEIFKLLQKAGNVDELEMRNVFNLGVGLVIAVDQAGAGSVLKEIKKFGEEAWMIGEVIKREKSGEEIRMDG
jgi:phosphoribosylformylglycinamidine cyclo-ligase